VANPQRSTPARNPRTVSSARAARSPRDLPQLDRLIHERLRLGIVSALAINDSLSFNDLKRVLKTSDGNLSVHAQKLEAAGYLRCNKFFQRRIPRTEYRLTPAGRKALDTYLDQMEQFIAHTREQT
jgi:DNA-binding HxlR family transcriptional regulator